MPIITTSTGKVIDTSGVDLAEQARLYSQIRAGSTNIGSTDIQNDRIQTDARGQWIGAPSNAAPGTWLGAMSYLNDIPLADRFAVATGQQPRPVTTQTPTPETEAGGGTPTPIGGPTPTGSQGYYGINYGNILGNMTSAQRRAMGPGNLGPSFRPMMAGAMPQMARLQMPAFPATMPSPFGAINETLMPGRRDSPGRIGPPPRERPEGTTGPTNNPPPGPTNTPEYFAWLRAATPEQLNALDPTGALYQLQRNVLQGERESLDFGGRG